MSRPTIVHIEVSGPTASGKSAIASLIRNALASAGYCVASPQLDEERRHSGDGMSAAARRKAVVTIGETNEPIAPAAGALAPNLGRLVAQDAQCAKSVDQQLSTQR